MKSKTSIRLAVAALFLASVAVALGLAEAAVRLAAPAAIDNMPPPSVYQYDSLLGWSKRPGASLEARAAEWDVHLAINTRGMRGPEIRDAHAPGSPRVLLLGDSFIEGYTVEEDQTVAADLQRSLRASGLSEAEVLNGGTAGYSTDQEVLYYERDGAALAPDITILFFYLNDVWYNARRTYWRGAKPYFELGADSLTLGGVPVPRGPWRSRKLRDVLRTRSALYRLVRREVMLARDDPGSDPEVSPATSSVPTEDLVWERVPSHDVEEWWRITAALLTRLHNDVVGAGGELLIFYVPSKAAVYPAVWDATRKAYGLSDTDWSPTADADRLARICEARSLECLIPVDRFRENASPLGTPGAPYFPIDGHWTVAGHRLAARIIQEWLDERR